MPDIDQRAAAKAGEIIALGKAEDQLIALGRLAMEDPELFNSVKNTFGQMRYNGLVSEADKAAKSAAEAKQKYEELKKAHPKDVNGIAREINALAKTNKVQAELVRHAANMDGQNIRLTSELKQEASKRYEEISKLYPGNKQKRIEAINKLRRQDPTLGNYVVEEANAHGENLRMVKINQNSNTNAGSEISEEGIETLGVADNSATGEKDNTSEKSGNEGASGNTGGKNLTITSNMDRALRMGPTILKERLEEMGYKFDRSLIRHSANGHEYIPTSKLRAWLKSHVFTDEQISQLNALVDDRASFDAKVKEVNERDGYTPPSRSATRAENGAQTQGDGANPDDAAKEEVARKEPAQKEEQSFHDVKEGLKYKMDEKGNAVWRVSGQNESAENPLKNGTYTFYKTDEGMFVKFEAPAKDGAEPVTETQGPMKPEEMANLPAVKALEKAADAENNKQYQFQNWQPMTEAEYKQYQADLNDKTYAALLSGMKPEELAKEKAELEAKVKAGDEDAQHKMTLMEKEEKERLRAEDKEAARKLYQTDKKKFKKGKEVYEKAAENGDARAKELLEIMKEVEQEESKDALKKRVKQDKSNAERAAQAVETAAKEGEKKSVKKALKNRANEVGNFFKSALGIKSKKKDENTASAATTPSQAATRSAGQTTAGNGTIQLEHDNNGNTIYTLSGYAKYTVGNEDVLYDGKYTVTPPKQGEDLYMIHFRASDGNQFATAGTEQELVLLQNLRREMTAQSSKQAQQQVIATQRTNG